MRAVALIAFLAIIAVVFAQSNTLASKKVAAVKILKPGAPGSRTQIQNVFLGFLEKNPKIMRHAAKLDKLKTLVAKIAVPAEGDSKRVVDNATKGFKALIQRRAEGKRLTKKQKAEAMSDALFLKKLFKKIGSFAKKALPILKQVGMTALQGAIMA